MFNGECQKAIIIAPKTELHTQQDVVMRKVIWAVTGGALMSLIATSACGDPLMPSGPANVAAAKKQNSLIGRTFSMRGGNAFGSGLISVGFAPYSRSVVAVYFVSVGVDYGSSTILPDLAAEGADGRALQKGDGFEIAYVSCKAKTYSSLAYPLADNLSNAERSWFVRGEANQWNVDASVSKNLKWALDLPESSRADLASFFSDVCEATY